MGEPTEPPANFTTEIDQNISRNLRSAREGRGWSQAELAQRVSEIGVPGIHQTTIARIESGSRPLRAAEAIAICRSLEITLEWLAESGRSADLRSQTSYLRQKAEDFDAALRELLHVRRLTAMQQDGRYPRGEEGLVSPDDVLRSGVDPFLYDALEDLIISSAPHEHLEISYLNELHDPAAYPRVGGEHKGRTETIAEDMREWLEGGRSVRLEEVDGKLLPADSSNLFEIDLRGPHLPGLSSATDDGLDKEAP